jgi:hypothetical protein
MYLKKYIILIYMESNKYTCIICRLDYKTPQSLWNHKNKFHKNELKNDHEITNDELIDNQNMVKKNIKLTENTKCIYCHKNFSAYTHMIRHLKKCKAKEDILKENEYLKKQLNLMEKYNKDIKELVEQFKIFISKMTYDDSSEELC